MGFVWVVLTGTAGLFAWLGIGSNWSLKEKALLLGLILSASFLLYVLFSSYYWFSKSYDIYPVKKIIQGEHHYKGQSIIILEKSVWISNEQVLTLFVSKDKADIPICLIKVQARTGKGYPQSIIVRELSHSDVDEYINESSRYQNLIAKSEIDWRHIKEWAVN